MGYGDIQYYDIIIFAAIAVFLVFRLRKVLGKRSGFKKNNGDSSENTNNHSESKVEGKIIPELDDNFKELK